MSRTGHRGAAWAVVFTALFAFGCGGATEDVPEGMVLIEGGPFLMGSNDVDEQGLGAELGATGGAYFENEHPAQTVSLSAYYIDRFEVTNARYFAFLVDTGYKAPVHWKGGRYTEGKGEAPVVNVTWFDAANYCRFSGKRLPTEAEWEKAARGTDGRPYPWGAEYDEGAGNFGTGETVPVGSFPTDESPYGVFDMGGNVLEWTVSWYTPYPGNRGGSKGGRSDTGGGAGYGEVNKVLRGGTAGIPGHYTMNKMYARASFRHYAPPGVFGGDTGFRCAVTPRKK